MLVLQGTFQVLFKYCSSTVLVLFKYCRGTLLFFNFLMTGTVATIYYERTVVGHFCTLNVLIFCIPSVCYSRDFTHAVNLYGHV